MKTTSLARLLTALLALSLGACGDDADDGDSSGGGGSGASGGTSGSGGGNAGSGPPVTPPVTFASCTDAWTEDESCQASSGTTYYVSASQGSDSNDGLSEDAPLATVAAVNALELQPGDHVLFRCGDVWRDDPLKIERSGTECAHIVFSSYPDLCEEGEQPELTGSQPITGWTQDGNVWVADLTSGENAGRFPQGINQVFREGARLPMGKWPNANDPSFDNGYSTIDRQPSDTVIEDDELPAGDWTGAVIRAKEIRWLLVSREVTGSSSGRLELANGLSCWGDGCGDSDPADPETFGWGYLITNHRATLDQEDEWFYDEATGLLYLVASSEPSGIEGSVIHVEDDRDWQYSGGVFLGEHLKAHIQYVVVENLMLSNWFSNGITTPVNLETDDNSHIVIRCNTVHNVESRGINLATWVWNAGDQSGWRGGHDMIVANNVVDGPNHFGINSYAYGTTFQGNVVRNVGLAENLGKQGLGCGLEGSNCTENGDGIRVLIDQASLTSHDVVFRQNVVEKTGYCGFDVFGGTITLEQNVIKEACSTKGDCGGVRTFGRDSFSSTAVRNIVLRGNLVMDTKGVTDGDNSRFKPLFGFGLYIDHFSDDVTLEGNAVLRSTAAGILIQDSRASIVDNILYNNARGTMVAGQVNLVGDSSVDSMRGNVLFAIDDTARTLRTDLELLAASDENAFFHPYRSAHISSDGDKTLAEWQAYSSMDASSTESFYTQSEGEEPRSEVFVNEMSVETSVSLSGDYVDLDGEPAGDSITVPPYGAVILVHRFN